MDSSEDGTQMWNGNEIVKLHLKSYRILFHKNRISCSKGSFLMQVGNMWTEMLKIFASDWQILYHVTLGDFLKSFILTS